MNKLSKFSMFVAAASLMVSWAAEASDYSRVLIPITVRALDGAYGTKWDTKVVVLQNEPSLMIGGFDYGTECPGRCGLPPVPVPNVPTQRFFYASAPDEPPGLIIYIATEHQRSTHVAATIFETSAGEAARTTPLPVVREDQFSEEPRYFLDVPSRSDQRLMLRIYSLDLNAGLARVQIRVFVRSENGFVVADREMEVSLAARQRYTEVFGRFPIRPLAAQFPVQQLLEGVAIPGASLTIVVSPLNGLKAWAFLSTTTNDNQTTTVTLPQ